MPSTKFTKGLYYMQKKYFPTVFDIFQDEILIFLMSVIILISAALGSNRLNIRSSPGFRLVKNGGTDKA